MKNYLFVFSVKFCEDEIENFLQSLDNKIENEIGDVQFVEIMDKVKEYVKKNFDEFVDFQTDLYDYYLEDYIDIFKKNINVSTILYFSMIMFYLNEKKDLNREEYWSIIEYFYDYFRNVWNTIRIYKQKKENRSNKDLFLEALNQLENYHKEIGEISKEVEIYLHDLENEKFVEIDYEEFYKDFNPNEILKDYEKNCFEF